MTGAIDKVSITVYSPGGHPHLMWQENHRIVEAMMDDDGQWKVAAYRIKTEGMRRVTYPDGLVEYVNADGLQEHIEEAAAKFASFEDATRKFFDLVLQVSG